MKRNIVYITDENYAMPTTISILSLIKNCAETERYKIWVLANDISAASKEKLLALSAQGNAAEIKLLDVGGHKYDLLEKSCISEGIHVSGSALYKFDIANILGDVDKVLYLDGDVIVNKDLAALFQVDISDSYIAAVDEMGDEEIESGLHYLASRIGLEDSSYFNSGVMMMNLKKMREDDIPAKLVRYRADQANYFMDQDAFNGVLYQKRVRMPYQFNFRTALFDVKTFEEINQTFFEGRYTDAEECINDQTVLHMSDRWKPWKYYILRFTDIFEEYYRISPYKNEKLSVISPLKELNDKYNQLYRHYLAEIKNYDMLLRTVTEHKIWKLPKDKIPENSRIILYGAGEVGRDFYRQIVERAYCSVVMWVDGNYMDYGDEIQSPQRILQAEYDFILIAVQRAAQIRTIMETLMAMGVREKEIISAF